MRLLACLILTLCLCGCAKMEVEVINLSPTTFEEVEVLTRKESCVKFSKLTPRSVRQAKFRSAKFGGESSLTLNATRSDKTILSHTDGYYEAEYIGRVIIVILPDETVKMVDDDIEIGIFGIKIP